jgi:integrase
MAHIERRQQRRADGTLGPVKYRARYVGPDGQEHSKTFDKKSVASRFLATQEANKAEGTWVNPSAGRVKLGEYADQFMAGKHNLKPKTRASYESLVQTCIKPTLGEFTLSALTPDLVEAWVAGLLKRKPKGLSPSRTRQAYNLLGAMCSTAARKRLITASPCQVEELPRLGQPNHRFLTATEIGRLAEAMDPSYEILVLVLAYTGIRIGEAAALRRGRCDILHRRLFIAESLAEVNGELFFGDTKTHQNRKVVLPEFLRAPLDEHLYNRVRGETDALVFTGPDGGPLRYSNFRTRFWLPAVDHADLAPLKIHDMRHTFASLAASNGASVKLVQTQLGHKDPALTLRLYQHLFPDDLDALGERMDETYRAAMSKISRPDDGLSVVRDEETARENGPTWTDCAPPVGLEPTTHGLGNRRSIL